MIGGATQFLLPFMDQSYRTYPYAAGRTLMGRAIALAALRNDDIMKMFQNYVLVSPESAEGVGGEGRAKMLDNTAILLTASKGDGETTLAAARACKAALDTRAGGPDAAQATTTVMQVDRHGEQQYRQEATLGFLIELRELDGAGRDELVRDGVVWVCERVEAQAGTPRFALALARVQVMLRRAGFSETLLSADVERLCDVWTSPSSHCVCVWCGVP